MGYSPLGVWFISSSQHCLLSEKSKVNVTLRVAFREIRLGLNTNTTWAPQQSNWKSDKSAQFRNETACQTSMSVVVFTCFIPSLKNIFYITADYFPNRLCTLDIPSVRNWIQFLPAESENLLEETLLENSNQSRYKQYLVKFTLSCSVLQLCSELLRQNNPFLLILTDKVSPQQIIKWYTMQRSSLDWAFSSVIMSFILSAKSANVCFLLQTRQQRSEDRHYNTRLSRQQSAGSL